MTATQHHEQNTFAQGSFGPWGRDPNVPGPQYAWTPKLLAELSRCDPYWRMRNKLERWGLPGFPGPTTTRICRTWKKLQNLVTPRVRAAVWKTMFNGWTTARRFQQRGRCHFCCSDDPEEDSIEHYAACRTTRSFARSFLGLGAEGAEAVVTRHNGRGDVITLGLNAGEVSDTLLTKRAVLVYSVYRATNHLRHEHKYASQQMALDLLQQYAKEAVRGHAASTRILLQRDSASRPIRTDVGFLVELELAATD